jgi:trigger factor
MDNHDWELTLKDESGWLPGFDAVFVGLQAGEEKDFALTYPEDSASRFKGQRANFHAVVKAVKVKVRLELNDEFARSLDGYESLADLRAKLIAQLTEQRTREAEDKLDNAAIEALIERATVAYPPQALDDTVDEIVHDLEQRVKDMGHSLEDYLRLQSTTLDKYRAQVRPTAEKRLRTRLALSELAQREGITVSDQEAQSEHDRLMNIADETGQTDEVRELLSSKEGQFVIRRNLLASKTLARLRAIVTGQAPELPAAETEAAPATEQPATEVEAVPAAEIAPVEQPATETAPATEPAAAGEAAVEPPAAEMASATEATTTGETAVVEQARELA